MLGLLLAIRVRKQSSRQLMHSLISQPLVRLDQYVRVKSLPHCNNAIHNSHAELAAEDSDEVHEPGECGSVGGARQCARFEAFEDDAAHQADIRESQGERHENLYDLKAVSRPRAIYMGPKYAAHASQAQTYYQNQPRGGVNHEHGNQPYKSKHRKCHPGQGVAGLKRTVALNV